MVPWGMGWFWRGGWEGDGDRFIPKNRGSCRFSASGREEAVLLGCMGHLAGNNKGGHPSPCPTGDMAVRDWVDPLSEGDAQTGTASVCSSQLPGGFIPNSAEPGHYTRRDLTLRIFSCHQPLRSSNHSELGWGCWHRGPLSQLPPLSHVMGRDIVLHCLHTFTPSG